MSMCNECREFIEESECDLCKCKGCIFDADCTGFAKNVEDIVCQKDAVTE